MADRSPCFGLVLGVRASGSVRSPIVTDGDTLAGSAGVLIVDARAIAFTELITGAVRVARAVAELVAITNLLGGALQQAIANGIARVLVGPCLIALTQLKLLALLAPDDGPILVVVLDSRTLLLDAGGCRLGSRVGGVALGGSQPDRNRERSDGGRCRTASSS